MNKLIKHKQTNEIKVKKSNKKYIKYKIEQWFVSSMQKNKKIKKFNKKK